MDTNLTQFYDELKQKLNNDETPTTNVTKISTTYGGPLSNSPNAVTWRNKAAMQCNHLKDCCHKQLLLDIYCKILPLDKEFIDGNFTEDQMRNVILCVIPASTQYKNDMRYKTLCQKVSEALNITNGYNFISIAFDRSDSREHKSADTIGNLSFSNSVYGKDVVLFDDIITRGTSFIQVANELKRKGAKSV